MEDEDDIPGKIGDVLRLGLIASVDLAQATAVVRCGDIDSPPCPWFELAGQYRSWSPPGEGEQVLLVCPEGDIAHGIVLRGLNSNSFPAPASGQDHELHGPAGLVIRLTGDGIEITAPGNVIVQGDVIADGISLKDHVHQGVTPGSGQSGAPRQ
ncbi:hypothetical protein MB02_01210 [Croceicoccus estronivorus]|uniref:phage baseplate assembly protein V n=1 Tax=Croceicoccus estronivorus TaxID=1172626 RepID=UPI00082EBC00|nr:phage baseplate assembly protein V [Croceicoccus estronivorus]OCC25321.1 hypothetical protein MB02_01210 [Croceicoccus estronivorus]